MAGGALRGFGCPGLSPLAEGLVAAELARGDGSIATFNAVHSGLAMTAIGLLGSDEQKQRWLPPMAAVDRLGAFALTEPEHGSDVVRLETRARREPDGGWSLTGRKRWIGNGTVADVVVVWARDDDGDVGAFVVEHPDGAGPPGARLPGAADHRQGGQPGGVAGPDRAGRGAGRRRRPAGRRPGPGTTPTGCWPSRGRPWPGRRSGTRSPPTRPR